MFCLINNRQIQIHSRTNRLFRVLYRNTATRRIHPFYCQQFIAYIFHDKSNLLFFLPVEIPHRCRNFIHINNCLNNIVFIIRFYFSALYNLQIELSYFQIMDRITHSYNSIIIIQQKSLKCHISRKMIQLIQVVSFINTNRMFKPFHP